MPFFVPGRFIETEAIFAYFLVLKAMVKGIVLSASAVVEKPTREQEIDNDILTAGPAKVILFNDDIHTFDEVIGQLVKATGCDSVKAEALAWEVHTKGKAAVFDGPMPECLRVSGVLEEIGLHTQIEV